MIKYALIVLPLLLMGCAGTKPTPPVNHYIEVPIPFCPKPDDLVLPKEGGINLITATTPPGDVVKYWDYEAQYWKNQAAIYKRQLDLYQQNGVKIENTAKELRDMIKAVSPK